MPILVDTHAALWSAHGKLAPSLQRRLDQAAAQRALLLSPISAWEIGMLAGKGRIKLSRPVREFVRALFADDGVVVAAITADIALDAVLLSTALRDPADQILVATALAYKAELMTKDRAILAFARKHPSLKCIAA